MLASYYETRSQRALTTQYPNLERLSRMKSRRNFRSWTPKTSRAAHEAKARKRMSVECQCPVELPVGRVLWTVRATDELSGQSFEVKIRQAPRRNQIIAETFGRQSRPHGVTWLASQLRKKLVTRWMVES